MTHFWHRLATTIAIVVLGVPITFAVTIALMPLWSMIERRYGIESVGHSGPSDWCFWVVFGVYLFLSATVMLGLRRSAQSDTPQS